MCKNNEYDVVKQYDLDNFDYNVDSINILRVICAIYYIFFNENDNIEQLIKLLLDYHNNTEIDDYEPLTEEELEIINNIKNIFCITH
jgi:hypothetical protein